MLLQYSAPAVDITSTICTGSGLLSNHSCYNIIVFQVGKMKKDTFTVSPESISHVKQSQLTPRKGIEATMVGLGLVTATTRTAFRFNNQKKLQLDDFVLRFACLALVASQIFTHVKKEAFFRIDANIHDLNHLNLINDPEAFARRILTARKGLFACFAFSWTSIFAVKICFLLFFYQMITRLQRLILYWKVTFGITLILWAFCISEAFIACPLPRFPVIKSALPHTTNSTPF